MAMKRVARAGLFGAAAAGFAATLPTAPAWAFVGIAVLSLVWTSPRPAPGGVRRLVFLALGATVVFGWILVINPVINPGTMKLWSLLLGYALGVLGSLTLVTGSPVVILTAIGLAAVTCFDLDAGVHPYLIAAGAAGFLHLAADLRPAAPPARRTVLLAASGGLSAAAAVAIVLVLPWTQGKVEETMVAVYSPATGGADGEGRSRLGELRSMKLSSRVVMRVWSERPQRLRSRALVRFDGRTWYADPSTLRRLDPSPELRRLDDPSRAFVASLPGADFVVAPEPAPGERLVRTRVLRIDGGGIATPGGSRLVRAPLASVRVDGAGIVLSPPGESVWLYGVLHDVDHRRAQEGAADEAALEAATELPDSLDPRIRKLAEELATGVPTREAVVDRVVSYLREHYRYSLDIGPTRSADPLAEFLFETRRGWCEYFAGAAAVLLRTRGIPTRYVRGLNVLGSQRSGDHYVVREWDRHAWIDVYLEGKGWIEYDPTPAAEYESLHAGLGESGLSELLEGLRADLAELYARLRTFGWARLLRPALWLGAFVLFAGAVHRVARRPLRWARKKTGGRGGTRTEIERLADDFERTLARLGHPRPSSRAPLEHVQELPEAGLAAPLRRVGIEIFDAYYRSRFGGEEVSGDHVEALRRLLSENLPRA